jgi:hypothetical protein
MNNLMIAREVYCVKPLRLTPNNTLFENLIPISNLYQFINKFFTCISKVDEAKTILEKNL